MTTRADTRATTKVVKEKVKKKAMEQTSVEKKKQRRKYVALPKTDDEKIEFDDNNQFGVASHTPKSNLEIICDNVKDNVDLLDLKGI